ncbi:MAG: prolipoprotein diacylglyceryl transferase [Candidatus Saganbacteria bacterium]|nr:prolipoprotein diacylglyceryl transferase [Candidatus Saganbacteria bacterium]
MFPVLFKFGGLELRSYGFFVALGFAAGILVSFVYARREKIARQLILDLALWVIIASVAGARLVYVLGQWDYYRRNLPEIIMLQNGGLVFLGGLLLALLTVYLFARRRRLPLLKLLDALTPGTALGYAIGRLGCFLNGCCFGLPTTMPWAIVFPRGSLAAAYCPDTALHPTQLYASLSMLFAFLALVWLYRAKKFGGQILFSGLVFYSLYRFVIEFFRFSPLRWLALTPSQWLVIPLFVLGIWGLVHFGRYRSL